VGAALGAGLGGFILLSYSYGMVGVILGAMGIISSIIIFIFAVDPTAQGKSASGGLNITPTRAQTEETLIT